MTALRGLLFLTLAAGSVASDCGDDPTGPGLGEEFLLAPDQRVLLRDEGVWVRFLRVAEDSRCPRQVQCVWAGDAEVVLEIAPEDGDAAEVTLHTNEESGPRSLVLGPRELTLLRLDPWPETPGGVAPEDYRAVLVLYERLRTTATSPHRARNTRGGSGVAITPRLRPAQESFSCRPVSSACSALPSLSRSRPAIRARGPTAREGSSRSPGPSPRPSER